MGSEFQGTLPQVSVPITITVSVFVLTVIVEERSPCAHLPWSYSAGGIQIIHRLVGAWQAKGFVRRLIWNDQGDLYTPGYGGSQHCWVHSSISLAEGLSGQLIPTLTCPHTFASQFDWGSGSKCLACRLQSRCSFIHRCCACTMSVSLQCTQSLQLLICNHHGTDWLSIQSESSLLWFKDMEDEFDRKKETGN